MKISIKREFEYIPNWNGNKKNESPIKAQLKNITVGERDACIVFNGSGDPMIDRPKLFRAGLARLDNLELNGEKIDTAEKVLEASGLYDLYIELTTEILKANQGQDLKN